MRVNKYVALATGLSRRAADAIIVSQEITVNGMVVTAGYDVQPNDIVKRGKHTLKPKVHSTTILLHKPVGYVCSRNGQGSKTIYELLPKELHHLKPVGRLDKDSSGLLLMTDDGDLAHQLTHPSFQKEKVYEIELDKPLPAEDFSSITSSGVDIGDDRPSRFLLQKATSKFQNRNSKFWQATLAEGRNRQIRRTFEALDYNVTSLHRIAFGSYKLGNLPEGKLQHK